MSGCTTQAKNEVAVTQEKMESKNTGSTQSEYTGEKLAGTTTPYVRYNEADFNKAKEQGKVVYLYFYANWCPICIVDRPKIVEAFNELEVENTVGFEVHYNDDKTTDADRAIARKLGVSYQHTTIILDSNGEVADRSLSPLTKEEIQKKIKGA